MTDELPKEDGEREGKDDGANSKQPNTFPSLLRIRDRTRWRFFAGERSLERLNTGWVHESLKREVKDQQGAGSAEQCGDRGQ
jgi:hypothetical protein